MLVGELLGSGLPIDPMSHPQQIGRHVIHYSRMICSINERDCGGDTPAESVLTELTQDVEEQINSRISKPNRLSSEPL